jgi:molybdopterin molybdotransferase/putative molybdopterin biosynthesis protein
VARQYGLGFIALQEEHYDFLVPKARLERPAVQAFRTLLTDRTVQDQLSQLGFRL